MVLTNYEFDPLLDMADWVGQRSNSYEFHLINGVTDEHKGLLTPIRTANLNHDTGRTIKRQLRMALGVRDTALVDPISDRVDLYMIFANRDPYPMGRYIFTEPSEVEFTSGNLSDVTLSDEMFLVDQQITKGVNGFNSSVETVIIDTLEGLGVSIQIEASPFNCVEAWGLGTNRGAILESLSITGDYFSPWFSNLNRLSFIRTFNPADEIPDFDLDAGNQVIRSGIVKTNGLLTAPNVFVVISNSASDPGAAVVGTAAVAPSAPHSEANRGFVIANVQTLQLSSTVQAQAVAQGLVNRQTIVEEVTLSTAPDPRYDSYNVVRWRGDNWLSLSWSLALTPGAPMQHRLRKAYR